MMQFIAILVLFLYAGVFVHIKRENPDFDFIGIAIMAFLVTMALVVVGGFFLFVGGIAIGVIK